MNIDFMGQIKSLGRNLILHRARTMRRQDTPAETHLWSALRAGRLGGMTWKRQVPLGHYILDFLCRDARLVVEVDGDQHADRIAYDTHRTAYIERCGLRVLRFWNSDVLTNRDGICLTILDARDTRRLSPGAQRREGED
ncbi:endonuclease domain-containing protein [Phenylobacterium sp.]|jgi:very-short-patch-repair endonuclease|uniref:endonuclease domain-containing protein n=1 Tax=Phenylobacterium sp. TaxID=1871053 RepID=UPI0037C8B977